VLQIGQKLKVVVATAGLNDLPGNCQPDTGANVFTHTIKRGENPTTIARKYGVSLGELYAANGWTKSPVIYAGQKITIKK
jgi:LysM repeat protein